jgi:peptidoglycan/xylan/chitin deacetylase (PgdA/CDA1 family)
MSGNARLWAVIGWVLSGALVLGAYAWWVRPDLRLWRGMATHGSPARASVALTFDDGPDPLWAPLLASTLERHGAKGTFFVVGGRAQLFPEITARLVRGGHQVSSHSMTHPYPNLTTLSRAKVDAELAQADAMMRQLGGDRRAIRPPGGGVNAHVIAAVRARDARIAWWTANAGDAGEEGHGPAPDRIAADTAPALRPGAVILMHSRPHTVLALEALLARPEARGYTYETFNAVVEPRRSEEAKRD